MKTYHVTVECRYTDILEVKANDEEGANEEVMGGNYEVVHDGAKFGEVDTDVLEVQQVFDEEEEEQVVSEVIVPKEVEEIFFRDPHEIVVRLKEHKGRTEIRHYENKTTRFTYDEDNKYVKEGLYTYEEEEEETIYDETHNNDTWQEEMTKSCKLCGMDNSKCYCGEEGKDRAEMHEEFKEICVSHGMSGKEIEKLVILSSYMLEGARGDGQ